MMKSIQTTQHGRVMVTLTASTTLRMQKKKGGNGKPLWANVTVTYCHIRTVDTLQAVGMGMSIKSEKEVDHSDEAQGQAAKRAFKRAVSWFRLEADRKNLWKAWGV